MRKWRIQGDRFLGSNRPAVMGIVNATPDSFSDGDLHADPPALLEKAMALIEDGADVIDLGGESTRPGSRPVPVDQELARILPALDPIVARSRVPVSVDTQKPEVAQAAIASGAAAINGAP